MGIYLNRPILKISLAVQESQEKLDRLDDWLGANVKGKRKAVRDSHGEKLS